jgi:hypothetical protein
MKFFCTCSIYFLQVFCIIAQTQPVPYNLYPPHLAAKSSWVFGEYAGLEVAGNSYNAFSTTITTDEGCASVYHPVTGALLFIPTD